MLERIRHIVSQPALGIANIRQRLAISHGKAARLDAGPAPDGYSAVIRLPLRHEAAA